MAVQPQQQHTPQPARRRRRTLRSSTVILGSMGALAAALSACSAEPDKRCVDRDSYDAVRGYKVINSGNCAGGSGGSGVNAQQLTFRQGGGNTGKDDGAAWYYDGETERGRAARGTFSHSVAVERGGFGCDDHDGDSSSGGGSYGG